MGYLYFRTSREVYDSARLDLDNLFGHPNSRAETCLPPEPAVATPEGEVFLALPLEMATWPEVAPLLARLLGDGGIVEVSEEDYGAALPKGGI